MCKCGSYSKPYFTNRKYLKLKRTFKIMWLAVFLLIFSKRESIKTVMSLSRGLAQNKLMKDSKSRLYGDFT